MFISRSKAYLNECTFPVRKVVLVMTLIIFSFLHAGKENDSLEQKTSSIIYVSEGTLISGIKELKNSEFKFIKKGSSKISKNKLKKLKSFKPTEKWKERKKENYKKTVHNKIEVSSKDESRKYKTWLAIKLHAVKENSPRQYDFTVFTEPISLRFFFPEKIQIDFLRKLYKPFLPDQYSFIRPPPELGP